MQNSAPEYYNSRLAVKLLTGNHVRGLEEEINKWMIDNPNYAIVGLEVNDCLTCTIIYRTH